MTFPYPENPDDWQTAYTRDMAYNDSNKYGINFPIVLGFLIALTYTFFCALPFFISESYSLLMGRLLGMLITFLPPFLLFYIMWMAAVRVASGFLVEFYRPPEDMDPKGVINNRLYGVSKLPPPLDMFSRFPYILVKDGEIDKKDRWPAWSALNLGGPIRLIIFDGTALYLERGNRFSRVVGPGEKIPFLECYETIKYVVDLRPKVKSDSFDVWTKDGIKVKFTIQIVCRIGDPSKQDPNSSLTYPYDPVAVKKAIERYALRWPNRLDGEPSEFTWIDAAWGQVTGIVPGYIGSRRLDDLFIADRNNGQILSPDSLNEVKTRLNNATKGFGVFITEFQILKVDLPPEVYEHQKEQWKTERQSVDMIIDGQSKAFHIRSREKARADAQRDLIMSIADGLKKNMEGRYTEPLLLSLSGILDNSLKDPLMRAYVAKESLDTLEQLHKILGENEPSDFDNIFK
jgi:regulator of protease activity HflC (stomatin/prohibitin superfamily)